MKDFREHRDDKRKPSAKIKQQIVKNLTCTLDGCDAPLTHYEGPGSDRFCRDHQLQQIEYGGMGRGDRPHTFHRSWICIDCGTDILDDWRLRDIECEVTKRQIARMLMHGDHVVRKADGGDDSKENVFSRCYVCHAKKTALNEDYRPPKT